MRKSFLLIAWIMFLITIISCQTKEQKKIDSTSEGISQIEPIINEVVFNEMSQAYGFKVGQDYSLEVISNKYPSLEPQIQIANLKFEKSFESSLLTIDSILSSKGKEWAKIKSQIKDQIKASVNLNNYNSNQMKDFILTVEKRASGEIPPPIIGTLLSFNPKYLKNPTVEFTDGFKYRFSSKGNEKAKGVDFHFDLPQSFLAKDANRPNIIQKFVSQNGHGLAMIMTLVLMLPEVSNVSDEDIKELAQGDEIKDMLPKGSQFINGGFIKIDNLPGLYQEYKLPQVLLDNELLMHTINYTVYYKDKMISIQCSVGSNKEDEKNTDSVFMKYKELFKLIAGSLVVQSQW
ncbi:MAG TPA: hypothetical protein VLN45_02855 [Ignavibacteriaceae bacterium]|nr:hypothetical protein [Ignavibacteriaceae bacterium]